MTWYVFIGVIVFIAFVIWNCTSGASNRWMFFVASFTVLWFFAAFRGETVGADTRNYLALIEQIKHFSFGDLFTRTLYRANSSHKITYEFGFKLIVFFLAKAFWFLPAYSILGILSFFILYFFFKAVSDQSRYVFLSVWLYITLGFYQTSLNMVQSSLAVAIAIWALRFIKEKNTNKWIAAITIAGLIHFSIFLVLPLYWLSFIRWSRKKVSIVLIVVAIVSALFIPISGIISRYIPAHYVAYLRTDRKAVTQMAVFVAHCILIFFAARSSGKKQGIIIQSTESVFVKPYFPVFLAEAVFYLFALSAGGLLRVATLFSPVIILYLPAIIEKIESDNVRKRRLIFVFVLCMCLYLLRLYTNNIGQTQPYVFRGKEF